MKYLNAFLILTSIHLFSCKGEKGDTGTYPSGDLKGGIILQNEQGYEISKSSPDYKKVTAEIKNVGTKNLDENQDYLYSNLPAGNYKVIASCDGYESISRTFQHIGGGNTYNRIYDFYLRKISSTQITSFKRINIADTTFYVFSVTGLRDQNNKFPAVNISIIAGENSDVSIISYKKLDLSYSEDNIYYYYDSNRNDYFFYENTFYDYYASSSNNYNATLTIYKSIFKNYKGKVIYFKAYSTSGYIRRDKFEDIFKSSANEKSSDVVPVTID